MNTPLRVLLIEDSESDALVIAQTLRQGGYDLTTERADTADRMKAALASQTWDVIIADYSMPHLGGLSALKRFQESGLDVPFIFVSGAVGEDIAVTAIRAGACDYLMKDNLARLAPAVERELREAKARLARRQTEEALRESQERYRSLLDDVLDTSAVGVFILDADFKVVWVNQALERYFGLRREEALGRDKRQLILARIKDIFEDPETFVERVFGAYDDNSYVESLECHVLPGHGREERWLEYRSCPIRSGLYAGGRIEHYYDITDCKQSQKALQDSEQRYRSFVESFRGIAFRGTMDFIPIFFHGAVEAITGYTAKELVAGKPRWDQIIHPEDLPGLFTEDEKQLHTIPDYSYDREYRILRKDRRVRWIHEFIQNVCDDAGKPAMLQGTLYDVTERKRSEQLLRTLDQAARAMEKALTSKAICAAVAGEFGKLGLSSAIFLVDESKSRLFPEFWSYKPRAVKAVERMTGLRARDVSITIEAVDVFNKVVREWQTVFVEDAAVVIRQLLPKPWKRLTEQLVKTLRVPKSINAPLIAGDEVIGILSVQSEDLTQADTPAITAFAHQVAAVLRKAQLFEQAQQEIAERMRAEEALKRAEWEKELILDSQLELVVYQDTDSRIIWPNRAACESVNMTREELIGRFCYEIWAKRSTPCPNCPVRLAIATGRPHEGEQIIPDGRAWFVRGHPVWDANGILVGAIEVAHDITERKQAEIERERLHAQIQEQARQVQQIVDTVPEGVLLLNGDRRVVLANPLGEKDLVALTGTKVGGILTRLGDRPLAELLAPPPRGLWHQVTTENRSFEAIARPVETSPASSGWVLVIRDVTKEREIQQRVQQQERLAAVGQLAAGIAHDFNNIMATIVLYAQMASRVEGLSTREQERLATIYQQANHATNLIQQILDFSRRAVLERRPIDLLLLLKGQVRLWERTLPENIEIELSYGPDEYTVNADPTRIQQAVMNLALNARDAMLTGGHLRIGLKRIRIQDRNEAPLPEMGTGEWIQMAIADTGVGISPDDLTHLYEPFYTTKASGKGTGLGLPQVYGIVTQHEGYIDVQSEVGQGTTFTIYLPALPISPPAVPILETQALIKGHGETILVVEDSESARRALADSLELLNYRVLVAAEGREALAVLTRQDDDITLVVSDVIMPEMGGIELLHTMREKGIQVKVLLLTGHPMEKEMESLRAQGLVGWMLKPVGLKQLAEAVARGVAGEL